MVRFILAALVGGLLVQEGDPVVHMSKEPRHRVVFESGTLRVQDIQIPPGDTTLFHTHDHAVLYVPISSSRTRSQPLGQDWGGGGGNAAAAAGRGSAPPQVQTLGRVSSPASYIEKPMTHRVNNIGDTLFRLISVANLSGGSDSNTDDVAGFVDKPELLNRHYRAYRITLPPGHATAAHRHAWPVVVVQQSAGAVAMDDTDKSTRMPGQYIVHESGPHQLKNAGDARVEFIEIEVRGAAAK
jgi:quercetin dioxygenase-like cupin family protein